MLKVKQVFDDSEQHFGAEKIRIVLAESGIHVGKKRISALIENVVAVEPGKNLCLNNNILKVENDFQMRPGSNLLPEFQF